MKCPKCKTENEEPRRFCRKCGGKLSIKCPGCGFENLPEDGFCGGCGRSLKEREEARPIDFNQPQSYTPKFLADKILTSRSTLEGERKLVTVLFADVVNYTSMSEKLDPEEVHQIMDGCFKILMDEIHKYEGTINQFTGDGVMALFGAPVAHEDHAQRACYAALSIQREIEEYGEKVKEDTGVEFRMRIGLNSGPVIVGSIGDDLRMDYTAIGDTTNLASRIESAAKPGSTLVSKNTHRLVRDFFELQSLGKLEVKGKENPQGMYELIKTGEVETRIGASVAKGLTRFVGRKNSMAAVMEAYEKAKSGSGQVLALVGEAGVGKSRLLFEMRNRLHQDEALFLEGRCLHFGGSMAYLPILDILRSYFGIEEGDREYLIKKKMKEKVVSIDEKLSALLPPFQDLLSLKLDDDSFTKLEPKEKRDKTFEALRDLLIRVSHDKPLIVAVEDLHWIDRTSEEFLEYLIGWLANSPILLILLYRPEYTHQWGSKSYYTQVGLNQLGTASSGELIRAILEEGNVAPELKALILDRAAGNPLFMEEFTHTLLENGSIERRNEQYVLNRSPSEIQVPDTIQGIIAARMDRLEDNIKRTMQVASVIGRDFAFRILQTITGMREELKSYLLNLQGLEFIYEKNLFPELEYIFKHALIQEVAYNSLLVKRRSEIHQKIGEAIESLYADRLEEFYEILAYHYWKSEDLEKAYQYQKLSGDKATRNFANQEAYRFYKEAIETLNKRHKTEEAKKEQINIRLSICSPIELLSYPEDSFQILQDGVKIAEEIGDARNAAIFLSKLGNYYTVMGDKLKAIKCSAKGFEEAEKKYDIDLMVSIGSDLMISTGLYGDAAETVRIASKLIRVIEKNHRESDYFKRPFNSYSELHSACTANLALLGNFKEGEAMGKKALRSAKDIKHLPSIAEALYFYTYLYYERADGSNVIKYGEMALKYCKDAGVDLLTPLANSLLGSGYFYLGEFQTSRKFLKEALQLQKNIGLQMNMPLIYLGLGQLDLELRYLKAAQSNIENAIDCAKKNNERLYEGISWTILGIIKGKKEPAEYDSAEGCIIKGIKVIDGFKLRPHLSRGYLYLGDLYNEMGRKDEASKFLKMAEEMFKEMEMDYYYDKTQEVLARL